MQTLNAQSSYITNGSAALNGANCFTLTPDAANQSGSVWYQNFLSLDADFDLTFTVNLGSNSRGADGIAFVLQPVNTAQGGSGNALGYGGINPSLAVEYDTYTNFDRTRDPNYDHIAIQKNGNPSHANFTDTYGTMTNGTIAGPVQASSSTSNIKDGQFHTTRINWKAATKTLQVYFDGSLRLTYSDDLVSNIFGGNKNMYWGFTGATGGISNLQQFCVVSTSFQEIAATPLSVNISKNDVTCNGGNNGSATASFTGGTPPYTFVGWSNGLSNTSISNLFAGDYTATVRDANGNTASKTVTILQPPLILPTITALGATTLCQGGSVILSASAASSYKWSSGETTKDINVTATGNYSVTVSNANGCSATSAATAVTVNPLPIATASNNGPLFAGETINLSTFEGGTVRWTGPDDFNATLRNPSIPNSTAAKAGIYTVTVSSNGCNAVSSTEVVIYPAVVTKNIRVALNSAGTATIVASDVYGGPGTNLQMSVDKAEFNSADLSNSPVAVTLTLSDVSGISSSKLAYVTVIDDIKPTINCIAPVVKDNDRDKCGAIVNYSPPFANDNSSTISTTLSAGCSDGEIVFTVPASNNVSSLNFISSGPYADIAHGHGQNNTVTVELFNSQSGSWVLVQTIQTGNGDFHFGGTNISFASIPQVTQIRFKSTESVHCAFHFYLLQLKMNSSIISQTRGLPPGSFFPVGSTTNTFKAIDASGNMDSCSFTVTVNDRQEPSIVGMPANITSVNDAGVCQAVVRWNPPTAKDNCSIVTFSADHQSGEIFPIGTTNVTYTATDPGGNITSANFTITVNDNEKPSINVPPNITSNTDNGKPFATINLEKPVTADNCKIEYVVSDHPSAEYPIGVTNVIWSVKDIHGNSNTATQKITVTDNLKPVITGMPLPIVQTNDAGICGAFVSWLDPKATDNSNLVTLRSSNSPGSIFLPGVTTVTYTANDNFGNTITESFTVTIKDNEGPKVNTKAKTVTLVNGIATITANDINNNSTDNCSITTLVASKTTFNCNDIGTNIVILSATDASGNVSSSPALVTVVGTVPTSSISPIPANTINTGGVPTNIYLGYGPQSLTLKQTTTGGSTVSYQWTGNGKLSCSNCVSPVFAPTAPGSYTFTCIATNEFGCKTTASITICVQDIRVPGTNGTQVYICHLPNNQPPQTVTVAVTSVDAYLLKNLGDKLGSCNMAPCTVTPPIAARTAIANETNEVIFNEQPELKTIDGLSVKVSPNPTTDAFTFIINGNNSEAISIRIINNLAQQVQGIANVKTGVPVTLGGRLSPGSYFADVVQGKERKIVKLIKVDR